MRKRVIRAGEIEIEDSEGRVRARFGVTNDDLPFLSFYGADDKLRARYGVQPDGSAGLAIADDDGRSGPRSACSRTARRYMVDRNGGGPREVRSARGSPTLAPATRTASSG
jgi:hypothetical protein